MATTYKVLGQASPSATTETPLYTVPALTSAVVSSINICNRSGAGTIRISVSVGGGATANKDYIFYDLDFPANETFCYTSGVTLAAGDVVRCYASSGDFSFNIFGSEIA